MIVADGEGEGRLAEDEIRAEFTSGGAYSGDSSEDVGIAQFSKSAIYRLSIGSTSTKKGAQRPFAEGPALTLLGCTELKSAWPITY